LKTAIKAVFVFSLITYFVSVPSSHAQAGSDERRSEVVSTFLTHMTNPKLYSSSDLVRKTQEAENAKLLGPHRHPDVSREIAKYLNMSDDQYASMISGPNPALEFSRTLYVAHRFKDIVHGSTDTWDWALIPITRTSEILGSSARSSCAIWLVFWTKENWFMEYASNANLHLPIVNAIPEFAAVPLDAPSAC